MTGIILGLGSSAVSETGSPAAPAWLRRAVAALKRESDLTIRVISPVYESDAMLPPGAPASWNVPYLNIALLCEASPRLATEGPLALLRCIKALEKRLGRRERERWAPREIDIDILAWGHARVERGPESDGYALSVPHPGLLERPFALLPLDDVAPDWIDEAEALGLSGARARLESWRWAGPEAVPYRTRRSRSSLTELVGILNITPDSFSDGGRFGAPELSPAELASRVLRAAEAAWAAGATILDVGAESTRPGAVPVESAEEWRRLEPALTALQPLRRQGARLSLDSRRPETVARAVAGGRIDWINDVSGFESPAMRDLAKDSGLELVFMHSLGIPPTRGRILDEKKDPVEQVLEWARRRMEELANAGIPSERLVFDPGIGFGKTAAQNLALLRQARRFHALGLRMLVGHSRKSFIAAGAPAERDLETALLTADLGGQGIEYLRIHDPASQSRALALAAALGNPVRHA